MATDKDTPIIIQSDEMILNPTPEQQIQYKRRLFETADRSFIVDRLNVKLPEGLTGEWHGTDALSQMIAEAKGFRDGSKYLEKHNKLHDNPEGNRVGDVRFMVIETWRYEAQREAERLQANRRSGISADANDEYREYAKSIGLGIQEGEVSSGRIIDGHELQAHLKR